MSNEDDNIKSEIKKQYEKWLVMLLLNLLKKAAEHWRLSASASSLSGLLFIQELLDGSSTIYYKLMRKEKSDFISLCGLLKKYIQLVDSKHLTIKENGNVLNANKS